MVQRNGGKLFEMANVLPIMCKGCVSEHCEYHKTKRIVVDEQTGMEFEIHCICSKHNKKQ